MNSKKKEKAFFALLCAGLWEQEARLEPYGEIDFPAILDMAEEQSVVGLIAAGIEHVADARPAKKDVLRFIGRTVQLEQRNQAMNYFIGVLVEKMREAGIYTLLVKGQGVAQCYERPLWRSCGDVDFFLSDENYEKAKETLPEDILSCDLCVVTDRHNEMYQKIYELLESEGYHDYSVSDMTDSLEVMNTVTLLFKTAMYGFTILLALIAAANINNTISTGVLLRRREFAMYKSVGMAEDGFGKMIRLETLLYGIRALMIGIPVSILISYVMFRAFDAELYSFNIDWIMYILVIVVVFAIVGASMLLSVNKLKGDSIIEALKNEMV